MARSVTISKQSAARILEVSERRVLRLIEEKKIAAWPTGHDGAWRIGYGSVIRYRQSQLKEEAKRK